MLRIAHLHDAHGACEVARYLAFLISDSTLEATARHRRVAVSRFAAGSTSVDADVIVSHLPVTLRSLPGLLALRARYPRTVLVHVEHAHSEAATVAARHRGRRRALLRTAYALFDHVVAISPSQAAWMHRHALVGTSDLSIIPPCANLEPFAQLPTPRGRARRIGAIGRLQRQSGFDILVEAFASVSDPEARLDIFGEGPQRAELRALARRDPRVRLHGNTTRLAALRLSDAIAMPSRWQPCGLAAREAQAAGRRVLHSGRDGLADIAGPGILRVADLSVAAWSRALSDVLSEPAPVPRAQVDSPEDQTVQGWQALLERLVRGPRCRKRSAAMI